ncbi:MAG: DUF983 domain-containing protein [Acidimicrobiia bacterium]
MSAGASPHPSTGTMLWRGLRRRCPSCGGGKLFRGYFNMVPECPRCGHRFEPRAEEGFFLGALTINLGVTQTLVLLGLFVYILVLAGGDGVPVVPLLVVSGILVVALPVLFYPFARTIWAACDLAMHTMDPNRDRSDPRRTPRP